MAVVVITTFDLDEYVYAALRAGARGFLLKDAGPALLAQAIRAAADGEALIAPNVTVRLLEAFAQQPQPGGSDAQSPAQPTEPLTARERGGRGHRRPWPQQQRDRGGAAHHPQHREDPPREPHDQARRAQSRRDRDLGARAPEPMKEQRHDRRPRSRRPSRRAGSSAPRGSCIARSTRSPAAAAASGCRSPDKWGTMRVTTIGRKTGQERSVILGYYEDGAEPRHHGHERLGRGRARLVAEPAGESGCDGDPEGRHARRCARRPRPARSATRLWARWQRDRRRRRRATRSCARPRPRSWCSARVADQHHRHAGDDLEHAVDCPEQPEIDRGQLQSDQARCPCTPGRAVRRSDRDWAAGSGSARRR